MRKVLMLLLGVFVLCTNLWAQNRTITGRITGDNGTDVPNASVRVKGTTTGTTTSADGTFSITVGPNARTLTVSSVGFATQDFTIGSGNTYSFSLKQENRSLEEVVVTGYTRERRSNFAGAATVIGSKAVETVPVGSFDQALQGRAPGLLVNSGSGQPGASPTITIRGVQSISGAGAQPLYIIDGIPIAAADFATINANDFESITVLKDANAAALYGARGGTGVIVITTKKGRAGTTNITARSQFGFTQAPDFSRLNLMNTQEMLFYEEREKLAGTPGWNYSNKNPAYSVLQSGFSSLPQQQARYDFLRDSIGKINSDWSDILYRQGKSQTHDVSLSGGTDRTRFFLSAGYFDQEGIDLGSALKRYTTRFNIDHSTDKLMVQFNTALGFSNQNLSEGEAFGNSARNPFQMTYRAKTYENPYRPDGSLIFGSSTNLALKQVGNLLEGIENSSLTDKQTKINSSLSIGYKVIPSVTLRNTFGVDVSSDLWQRYVNPGSYVGTLAATQPFGTLYPGLNSEAYRVATQLVNTSSAIFNKKFGVHEVDLGAYFEVVRGYQKALGFTLYNLDPRVPNTGQGAGTLPATGTSPASQYATSAKSGFGIRSYFGTARYTYNDKYTVNANLRRDGTSRIVNPDNREITTWSAGAIWNVMRESFMNSQNIFSDVRLRASYGIVPNIGSITSNSYGILGTTAGNWVTVTNYQGPQLPGFGNTTYAGASLTGIAPTGPGNPDLNIEYIQKTNIGLDFGVWKNRARFTVDAYNNKTIDLFVSQPLPATSGFGGNSLPINAGTMTNKGLEFTAAVDVVRAKDFGFSISFNHAINVNKIEDLGLVNEYPSGTFIIRKGLPYGTHYTYNYLRADPATGAPVYETLDGKETTDAGQAGLFAKFGTYLPKHVGGFNPTIRIKGFTIDALFSYQFDVVRSNNIRNWITRGTPGYHTSVNASRELLTNQWQKPGDMLKFQSSGFDRGFTSSDLEDAKFLRFRNLNIAYQLPAVKTKSGISIIKGARFYVQVQNLAVWSPWTGLDPEDGNNISLNEYPNPRTMVAGIDINF